MIDTNKKDSKEYMGKKLRLARTISNLTQEELAEKLSLTPEYVTLYFNVKYKKNPAAIFSAVKKGSQALKACIFHRLYRNPL